MGSRPSFVPRLSSVSALAPTVQWEIYTRFAIDCKNSKDSCEEIESASRNYPPPPMSQEFRINQFHYAASPGDAVTNHMFLIQKALLAAGIKGSICAVERKHLEEDRVQPFRKERIWDCDLLLIHHSHGNPVLSDVLGIEIPKAVIYHNVTPASFFPHDPHIQHLCAMGRDQLLDIRGNVVAAFADSQYNANELLAVGFKNVRLLPLLDLSQMEVPQPNGEPVDEKAPVNLLFVGRLSPHKNQSLLIETFFYLKPKLPRHSRLVLVGGGDPVYTSYLKLLAKQLGVSHSIQFTGKVTDKELTHLYESADALVCTSLHEGFCIPLVEAMKQDVPVFYLPEGAIPETMGASGMRLDTQNPIALAELLNYALRDSKILDEMRRSQAIRLTELKEIQRPEFIQNQLLPLLENLETRYFEEKTQDATQTTQTV